MGNTKKFINLPKLYMDFHPGSNIPSKNLAMGSLEQDYKTNIDLYALFERKR